MGPVPAGAAAAAAAAAAVGPLARIFFLAAAGAMTRGRRRVEEAWIEPCVMQRALLVLAGPWEEQQRPLAQGNRSR